MSEEHLDYFCILDYFCVTSDCSPTESSWEIIQQTRSRHDESTIGIVPGGLE